MKQSRFPYYIIVFCAFLFLGMNLRAQTPPGSRPQTTETPKLFADSIPPVKDPKTGKVTKGRSPRVAAIRSAVLPGLGQIYNRKYWKLPLVYGALGATGGIFWYNLQWYNRTRYAYKVLVTNDTAGLANVHSKLRALVANGRDETLRYYRDSYRRDIDYSAIFFIIAWGLNVVDASVDAHLSTFDVSRDLSFKIKVGHSEMAGTNGVSFVLAIK